jgi:crotonobetainyl-CoA:carnitine CoA-transferase CaiB-like acyl-CoA transferase
VVPAALVADIAGGAYPAVMNILLALRQRDATGAGCMLDVSMSDNVFPFLFWAMGQGEAAGEWPGPGTALLAGGSPRYQIYRTRDGRHVAAAPLEQKFWDAFTRVIGLAPELVDDARDPQATKRGVAACIAARSADEWRAAFAGQDVCCSIVSTMQEAMHDAHFRARGLFARKVATDTGALTAAPVPVAEAFRASDAMLGYPRLGDANDPDTP